MNDLTSAMGLPGADDPAYAHELDRLARACRDFLGAFDRGDFDGCMLMSGAIHGHCIAVYKLSPPAGLVDFPAQYERPEESPNA